MIAKLRGRLKPFVAVCFVVLVVVVALLMRPTSGQLPAYHPQATDPLGYAGLRELVSRYADVSVSATLPRTRGAATSDTYVVSTTGVTSAQQRRLSQLAQAGATVVYADPLAYPPDDSTVTELELNTLSTSTVLVNECGSTMPSLANVQSIRVSSPGRLVLADDDTTPRQGCFVPEGRRSVKPDDESTSSYFFVVARQVGDGTVVNLGDGQVWSNRYLGDLDNAALAIALLAPQSGTRVQFVLADPDTVADGDEQVYGLGPMLELAPTWSKAVALNLLLAFVVFAVARSRRVGRPIEEPFVADVQASQQTVAVANILRAGRHADQAAKIYRQTLRERLVAALRLPSSIATADLCQVAAQRLSIDRSLLDEALISRYVKDSAELLALTKSIEAVESRLRSNAQLVQTSKEK